MKAIHFFDVDHTITRGSTGLHYLYEGVRMGVFPFRPLIAAPFVYLQYRLGRMDSEPFEKEVPALRGRPRDALEAVAERCFERRIRGRIFQGAERLIRTLTQEGNEIVFATLSVDLIVKPLADYLGVRDVIASSFEFHDGVCTGRFMGAPMFSQHKHDLVLAYLAQRGIAPEHCHFYTDSINDLPLLQAIGHPVVVNPDQRLARLATENGWRVLQFN